MQEQGKTLCKSDEILEFLTAVTIMPAPEQIIFEPDPLAVDTLAINSVKNINIKGEVKVEEVTELKKEKENSQTAIPDIATVLLKSYLPIKEDISADPLLFITEEDPLAGISNIASVQGEQHSCLKQEAIPHKCQIEGQETEAVMVSSTQFPQSVSGEAIDDATLPEGDADDPLESGRTTAEDAGSGRPSRRSAAVALAAIRRRHRRRRASDSEASSSSTESEADATDEEYEVEEDGSSDSGAEDHREDLQNVASIQASCAQKQQHCSGLLDAADYNSSTHGAVQFESSELSGINCSSSQNSILRKSALVNQQCAPKRRMTYAEKIQYYSRPLDVDGLNINYNDIVSNTGYALSSAKDVVNQEDRPVVQTEKQHGSGSYNKSSNKSNKQSCDGYRKEKNYSSPSGSNKNNLPSRSVNCTTLKKHRKMHSTESNELTDSCRDQLAKSDSSTKSVTKLSEAGCSETLEIVTVQNFALQTLDEKSQEKPRNQVSSNNGVENEVATHFAKSKFQCEICDMIFVSEDVLQDHLVNVHFILQYAHKHQMSYAEKIKYYSRPLNVEGLNINFQGIFKKTGCTQRFPEKMLAQNNRTMLQIQKQQASDAYSIYSSNSKGSSVAMRSILKKTDCTQRSPENVSTQNDRTVPQTQKHQMSDAHSICSSNSRGSSDTKGKENNDSSPNDSHNGTLPFRIVNCSKQKDNRKMYPTSNSLTDSCRDLFAESDCSNILILKVSEDSCSETSEIVMDRNSELQTNNKNSQQQQTNLFYSRNGVENQLSKFGSSVSPDKVYRRKKAECANCGKILTSNKNLIVHMQTVHSNIRAHSCKECGKAFKTVDCLKSHMRVHSDEKPFKCEVCGRAFKFNSPCVRHTKLCKGIPDELKCDVCGKILSKTSLKRHMVIHTSGEPTVKCSLCDKVFISKQRLKCHVRNIHEGKKPQHVCEICGKVFKAPSDLKDHIADHKGEKAYTCHVCGKSFGKQGRLAMHLRIHGEKTFRCDICNFTCNRLQNLETHIRKHTGEKPYKCFVCAKRFSRHDNLQTHIRKAHKFDKVSKTEQYVK